MTEPRDRAPLPKMMTPSELAEHLSVNLSRIYELLRDGHIPYVKIGSQIRFDQHEIDKWVAQRRVKVKD